MSEYRISVLVNTFNRADYLRNCLTSYLRQTFRDFEVVIADDGSTDQTADVLAEFGRTATFPIRHVRQESEGHRRARILNKGLAACRAPTIVFTDCDAGDQAGR